MHKIQIVDIENAENKILHIDINENISEVSANIEGSLDLISLGELINVRGHIAGSTKLTCDRCLSEYDYDLDIDIDETYAKNQIFEYESNEEIEITNGQFITDLNGSEEIDIYDLLYQSVILSLPNKKVCGINCKEDMFEKDNSFQVHDDRMDIFKTIKIDK